MLRVLCVQGWWCAGVMVCRAGGVQGQCVGLLPLEPEEQVGQPRSLPGCRAESQRPSSPRPGPGCGEGPEQFQKGGKVLSALSRSLVPGGGQSRMGGLWSS